jgi:hypothetical protein
MAELPNGAAQHSEFVWWSILPDEFKSNQRVADMIQINKAP